MKNLHYFSVSVIFITHTVISSVTAFYSHEVGIMTAGPKAHIRNPFWTNMRKQLLTKTFLEDKLPLISSSFGKSSTMAFMKPNRPVAIMNSLNSRRQPAVQNPWKIKPRYLCPKTRNHILVTIHGDREKCNRYFYCRAGKPFVFECDSGLFYDPEISACTDSYFHCGEKILE